MVKAEYYDYEDDGATTSEIVIKTPETEFVVVNTEVHDKPRIYQRGRGDTHPHTKLYPEEMVLGK